uniref:STAS domain-containing protein n=1 Tax=Timema tahoe TaxID=61484 RepID=A0A7R9ILZ8_9NEOP|nr:unnamed protein product [Timema tahoe]
MWWGERYNVGPSLDYGLYSCFMSSFVYIFFGSCKDVTVGPTAILGLLTQPYVMEHTEDFAVLICFISGTCIPFTPCSQWKRVTGNPNRLPSSDEGFLVDFISIPVTVGFTSAAAITIGSSQLKSLLGIPGSADGFLDTWINFFRNIGQVQKWDSILGFGTIVVLLAMRKLKDFSTGRNNTQLSLGLRLFRTFVWLLSLARNALVIIIGIVLAYTLSDENGENAPFRLTGDVREGLPPFQPPPFSTSSNTTEYTFGDMVNIYGTAIGVVPLLSILGHIAIAKAFAKGKPVDATQELIALGLCNIGGSFVRSMPVTGSFTRTAVNNASGVHTTLGGLFTGAFIMLTLAFLTSTFAFIPRASLAGLIVCAMIFMVEYDIVPLLWRTSKLDLVPLTATFLCCLLISLEYGMIIGVGINLISILYKAARPRVHIQHLSICSREVLLVRPDSGLFFPAAENLREIVLKASSKDPRPSLTVVIDGSYVHSIDATMAKNLKLIVDDLKVNKRAIIYWNWGPGMEKCCRGVDDNLAGNFRRTNTIEDVFRGEPSEGDCRNADDSTSTVDICTGASDPELSNFPK